MEARSYLLPAAMVAVAAATSAWLLLSADPPAAAAGAPPAAKPGLALAGHAQLRELQAQADAACLCARRAGNEPRRTQCWAGFERNVARFRHSESASLCMEESTTELCFEGPASSDIGDRCIFRQRMYGACSAEEAAQRFQQAEAGREADSDCG